MLANDIEEINVWNVMYEYTLFVIDSTLYIINLDKQNSGFAIRLWEGFQGKRCEISFIGSFVGYHRSLVYVASPSEIRIFSLEDDVESGADIRDISAPRQY